MQNDPGIIMACILQPRTLCPYHYNILSAMCATYAWTLSGQAMSREICSLAQSIVYLPERSAQAGAVLPESMHTSC